MPEIMKCGGENKFVVIKREDARKYLTPLQCGVLGLALGSIEDGRTKDGRKSDNEYLVINTDEPYAPEVIEIMKRHGHWGPPQEQKGAVEQ